MCVCELLIWRNKDTCIYLYIRSSITQALIAKSNRHLQCENCHTHTHTHWFSSRPMTNVWWTWISRLLYPATFHLHFSGPLHPLRSKTFHSSLTSFHHVLIWQDNGREEEGGKRREGKYIIPWRGNWCRVFWPDALPVTSQWWKHSLDLVLSSIPTQPRGKWKWHHFLLLQLSSVTTQNLKTVGKICLTQICACAVKHQCQTYNKRLFNKLITITTTLFIISCMFVSVLHCSVFSTHNKLM